MRARLMDCCGMTAGPWFRCRAVIQTTKEGGGCQDYSDYWFPKVLGIFNFWLSSSMDTRTKKSASPHTETRSMLPFSAFIAIHSPDHTHKFCLSYVPTYRIHDVTLLCIYSHTPSPRQPRLQLAKMGLLYSQYGRLASNLVAK